MTTNVLPEIDRTTVDDLRKKLPDLTELELPKLPSMQQVGKSADQTIDRLLGRSRPSVWPWIAAGIALVAVASAIAAYLTWFRRPTTIEGEGTWLEPESSIESDASDVPGTTPMTGMTAAETSLATNPYPPEEA